MSMEPVQATDILVRTADPALLDRTIQQLGPACVIEDSPGVYAQVDGCYVVRTFGNSAGFIKFAIKQQGYAEFVRELEDLL